MENMMLLCARWVFQPQRQCEGGHDRRVRGRREWEARSIVSHTYCIINLWYELRQVPSLLLYYVHMRDAGAASSVVSMAFRWAGTLTRRVPSSQVPRFGIYISFKPLGLRSVVHFPTCAKSEQFQALITHTSRKCNHFREFRFSLKQ